jgi:hypothetical protein
MHLHLEVQDHTTNEQSFVPQSNFPKSIINMSSQLKLDETYTSPTDTMRDAKARINQITITAERRLVQRKRERRRHLQQTKPKNRENDKQQNPWNSTTRPHGYWTLPELYVLEPKHTKIAHELAKFNINLDHFPMVKGNSPSSLDISIGFSALLSKTKSCQRKHSCHLLKKVVGVSEANENERREEKGRREKTEKSEEEEERREGKQKRGGNVEDDDTCMFFNDDIPTMNTHNGRGPIKGETMLYRAPSKNGSKPSSRSKSRPSSRSKSRSTTRPSSPSSQSIASSFYISEDASEDARGDASEIDLNIVSLPTGKRIYLDHFLSSKVNSEYVANAPSKVSTYVLGSMKSNILNVSNRLFVDSNGLHFIGRNKYIETLNISNNILKKNEIINILESLIEWNNDTLFTLIMKNIGINDSTKSNINNMVSSPASLLKEWIMTNECNLHVLCLSNNNIGNKFVNELLLFSSTIQNPALIHLDLSYNSINDLSCIFRSTTSSSSTTTTIMKNVRTLNVSWNPIVPLLPTKLSMTSSLYSLNLSYCSITDDTGVILIHSLKRNLKKLNLSGNKLSKKTAYTLSDWLQKNSSIQLTDLFLSNNINLTMEGCIALLLNGISHNISRLKNVCLDGCTTVSTLNINNNISFLKEISIYCLIKQQHLRYVHDRRTLTTNVTWTLNEKDNVRSFLLNEYEKINYQFFGQKTCNSIILSVQNDFINYLNERNGSNESIDITNYINWIDVLNEDNEKNEEKEGQEEKKENDKKRDQRRNNFCWSPERSILFTKRAKSSPSKSINDEHFHEACFEYDWISIYKDIKDLLIEPGLDKEEDDQKNDKIDDDEHLPSVVIDIRETLRHHYTALYIMWYAYSENKDRLQLKGYTQWYKKGKINLPENVLMSIFNQHSQRNSDNTSKATIKATGTTDTTDTTTDTTTTTNASDEKKEDEEFHKENDSQYISRRNFLKIIISIGLSYIKKNKKEMTSLNDELNKLLISVLCKNILNTNYITYASPFTTTDGWRRKRYLKKNIEVYLLKKLKPLKKLFLLGKAINPSSVFQNNRTTKLIHEFQLKMKLTINLLQWNILLSSEKYLNIISASFNAKKVEQCYQASLPMQLTPTNSTHELSFYSFIEALVRVTDTDQDMNLIDNIQKKFNEWNL